MASLAGFEPATRCLEGSRSVQLSYRDTQRQLTNQQIKCSKAHRCRSRNRGIKPLLRAMSHARGDIVQARTVAVPKLGYRDNLQVLHIG